MLNGVFKTALMPFNIFESKGNVESMLNESSNQFKFDKTRFNICHTLNNVERILKQMLKPLNQALR